MKIYNLFFLVFFSLQSYAQFYFGVPFLDRNRKIGECPVCETKDTLVSNYLKKVDLRLQDFSSDKQITIENAKLQIAYLDSLLLDPNISDIIRARLINSKIERYCLGIIEEGDQVYNFAISTQDSLTNFDGPAFIISLFDEIIALNIDPISKSYFQRVKLAYYTQGYLFYELNDGYTDWLEDDEILKQLPNLEQNLAQNFLDTRRDISYNPFHTYDAYGFGLSTSYGKELWYGGEFSFDPFMESANPFRRFSGFGYRNDIRVSWINFKLLINKEFTQLDLLYSVLDFKNYFGFKANLAQFGLHNTSQYENKWFYRPEIGYTYGIFTLSYSYNLTFDQTIRPFTEKHMVNFSISYPLLRIGKYY